VITAALLSVVEPKKETVWSDLYPSWSLTVYRVECTGSLSTSDKLVIGVGHRPDSPQGAVSLCNCDYGGFAKCWGAKGERERAWSDLYSSWSLTAIPCMAVWHLASLTTDALLLL
jgi:hypothetical protein